MAPLHTAATVLVRIYESNLQSSPAGNFEVHNIVHINAHSSGMNCISTSKSIHATYNNIKKQLEVFNNKIYEKKIKMSLRLMAAQSGIPIVKYNFCFTVQVLAVLFLHQVAECVNS